MASSNFLQWNPSKVNQEDDSTYSGDSLRTGGATNGALFPSSTANKLFYQLSTLAAALAQSLANKGYDVSDSSLSVLTATLANMMTQADMSPYAPLDSPAFIGSPTAPTPVSLTDSSTKLVTTAWARSGGALSNQVPGYLKLPSFLTGVNLIIQWGILNANLSTSSAAYPVAFTTRIFALVGAWSAPSQHTFFLQQSSLSGFSYAAGGAGTISWLAIGY